MSNYSTSGKLGVASFEVSLVLTSLKNRLEFQIVIRFQIHLSVHMYSSFSTKLNSSAQNGDVHPACIYKEYLDDPDGHDFERFKVETYNKKYLNDSVDHLG